MANVLDEISGVQATIETHIPILFLDIHLRAGSSFLQTVPEAYNGIAYVWRGSGQCWLLSLPPKRNLGVYILKSTPKTSRADYILNDKPIVFLPGVIIEITLSPC